jgi:hypothetical protein
LGRAKTLRLNPIFDSNIFGHVQDGSICKRTWRFLLRHRPGHGWPLSMVSALELLAGFDNALPKTFPASKEQIKFAYELSKGRILEDPTFLLCKEVLRVPFPPKLERPRPDVIADYMQVVRSADSLEQIRAGHVPVTKLRSKGGGQAGFAGLTAAVVKELLAGPKREWVEGCEALVSEIYPQWREHLQRTGKRLPDQMREEIKSRTAWDTEKAKWTETKLKWLEASTSTALVADVAKRLDAVLEFTVFVSREILLRNYNVEKHDSDVYDQFQLHYLAVDRFVIVTQDPDLLTRTTHSSQAGRIVPFERFLQGL